MDTTQSVKVWEKTTNLRIHRYVTSYTWSTGWDENYRDTLQQMYRCTQTGEVRWEAVELVTEIAPNCPRYG